jgi:hypothetical protein
MKCYTSLILVLCLTSAFAMAFRKKRSLETLLEVLEERLEERDVLDPQEEYRRVDEFDDDWTAQEEYGREYTGCNWTDKKCPKGKECMIVGPSRRRCVKEGVEVPLDG